MILLALTVFAQLLLYALVIQATVEHNARRKAAQKEGGVKDAR